MCPSGAQAATGRESLGRRVGVICAPMGALVVIFGPLDRLLKGLGPTFESNIVGESVFAILMPRLGETTTFEDLAAQVGATSSRKSHPRGARGSQSRGQESKKDVCWPSESQAGSAALPQLWNSSGNRRESKSSEVKVYLTDNSYD